MDKQILVMNHEKKTTTIYEVDAKLTDGEVEDIICGKEESSVGMLSYMEVSNDIALNREYFISFGSSHVYPWMNGVNPLKVLLRVLAPSMTEAREKVFKALGDKWNTSYHYSEDIYYISTIIKFEDIKDMK